MTKFTVFLTTMTISLTAAAATPIISGYRSRDGAQGETLLLNQDGQSCTRKVNYTNGYKVKPEVKTVETSDACKALQVGAQIEKDLGHKCTGDSMILSLTQNERHLLTAYENISVVGEQGFTPGYPYLDSLTPTLIEQSCTCVKSSLRTKNFGLGSLNVLETVFNGPYHYHGIEVKATTAEECTQFFKTDAEKEIVRASYRKYGLK